MGNKFIYSAAAKDIETTLKAAEYPKDGSEGLAYAFNGVLMASNNERVHVSHSAEDLPDGVYLADYCGLLLQDTTKTRALEYINTVFVASTKAPIHKSCSIHNLSADFVAIKTLAMLAAHQDEPSGSFFHGEINQSIHMQYLLDAIDHAKENDGAIAEVVTHQKQNTGGEHLAVQFRDSQNRIIAIIATIHRG